MVDAVGDRLPAFTAEQSERIKGSYDFYGLSVCLSLFLLTSLLTSLSFSCVSLSPGLNHYTSKYAAYRPIPSPSGGWGDDQATSMTNTDAQGNLIGAQAASSWSASLPLTRLSSHRATG
jgi:hypothetical protein